MHKDDAIRIADEFGTPLYLYDLDAIEKRARAVQDCLGSRVDLLYAVKANPNRRILQHALNWADGLDISSGGELRMSLNAGWDPRRLSLAGPGKTWNEVELAVKSGCGSISVESRDDLERILEVGTRLGLKPQLALRVNPLELTGPFALKMGGKPTQFGVDEEDAPDLLLDISKKVREGQADFVGIHIYAGTQCLEAQAIVDSARNNLRIVSELEKASGLTAAKVNLGGGFGVAYYEGQDELDLEQVGAGLSAELDTFLAGRPETRIMIELGRYLTAPAGWYLSRVLAVKQSRGKVFAILDGGMHHHLSASGNLGQTIKRNYRLRNLSNSLGNESVTDLAGCLCTPIDLLGFGTKIPEARCGDVICVENSGSYGYTASPLFFLGHDAPREIIIEKGKPYIAREALSPADFY